MSLRVPGAPAFLAALLACALFSGCVSNDTADDAAGEAAGPSLGTFVNPMILDHDHDAATGHDLSWNMVRTGGRLLEQGQRGYAQPHALDIKANHLFVSAYAATGDPVAGLYIFDLSEAPDNPPLVGQWNIPGPAGGDRNMEATEDGRYVVMSYEGRDCAGNINPVQPGLYLLDTSDPVNPTEVDFKPVAAQSLGQHSITIFSTKSDDWVYHGGGDNLLYRIDRQSQTLEEVGTFQSGHDSSVFEDRINGMPLLLSADVSSLNIYDLSDPVNPRVIGTWQVPNPASYYVHTAVADEIAGRNILVVNSEDFRHDPTAFWILDITDPTAPVELSQWTAPDGIESGDLLFSLHNPRIEAGLLSFSFYHAGVWQFDLNDPASWTDPQPRGFFLPTDPVGPTPAPDGTPIMSKVCGARLEGTDGSLDVQTTAIPFTFDVEVQGAYVYAADLQTGVHVLQHVPGAGTVGHDAA